MDLRNKGDRGALGLIVFFILINAICLVAFGGWWALLSPFWVAMAPLSLGFAAFASLPGWTKKDTIINVCVWTALDVVMAVVLAAVATHSP